MGLVSEIFTDDVLDKLPGPMAIGHTRYSTTGDSALLNAQPIRVDSTKGLIAIAHNGNLVNLGNLRMALERDGAYFKPRAILKSLSSSSRTPPPQRLWMRLRIAGQGGRRVFNRDDDARPHLCSPRSTRVPAALDGADEER